MSVMPAEKLDENGCSNSKETSKTGSTKGKVLKFVNKKTAQTSGLSEEERTELVLEFRLKARKLGRSILRKWHARMDLQEVDSIVDLSLCEAVKRFDPTKGASFMTFLYYHLKGNLIRAVSAAANANAIPTDEDIPAQTHEVNGVHAIDVAEALCNHDHLMPDEVLFKKQLIDLSTEACARLDGLEREVIQRIYIEGQQLMDIANSLGYSRCHISRVKKKALDTLQRDMMFALERQQKLEKIEGVRSDGGIERKQVHRRRPRSKKAVATHRAPKRLENDLVVNS